MSKLKDVDKIDWQKGVFVNPNIRKIATIKMLRDWRDWQEEVKAIQLDKVKQARAEIEDKIYNYPDRNISEYEDCLAILDKLIESEDKE